MSVVMKFGGTSVADANAIKQVVEIIEKRKKLQPFIVVSAFAGITDLLLRAGDSVARGRKTGICKFLKIICDRHFSVTSHFREKTRIEVERAIADEINELKKVLNKIGIKGTFSSELKDRMASFGERLSSWVLFGALNNNGILASRIDSRKLIVTDDTFGNACVNQNKTRVNFRKIILPLMHAGIVPVMTGFIANSESGKITTLGRGGSDYSAAIAAVSIGAGEIQIWKDVDGFMTADPGIVTGTRLIRKMFFDEAAELTYFGAKVLHPKTIESAIQRKIPVRILNTYNPREPGTLIRGAKTGDSEKSSRKNPVTAISIKEGIAVINLRSLKMLGHYGFLAKIFGIFSAHRVPVDVVATSEVNVSMTVEENILSEELISDLSTVGKVNIESDCAIISVVGRGVRKNPPVAEKIFSALKHGRVPTVMVSKGASAINFTFIIKRRHCRPAVRKLHSEFFN